MSMESFSGSKLFRDFFLTSALLGSRVFNFLYNIRFDFQNIVFDDKVQVFWKGHIISHLFFVTE